MPNKGTLIKGKRAGYIPSDPAWERAKAARRNLGHDDAAQESFFLQKQFRSLWSGRMVPSPVDVNQILRTLTGKKIPFVLTGAHAIGGWTGRPRDTHDVDILVKAGRNHARAVKALRELYPELEVRNFPGLVAFFLPGETDSVVDVVFPHRGDLAETLAQALWIENKKEGLRYRIPSLETALANKYGAMLNPDRSPGKRLMDAADFTFMVSHSSDPGQNAIDLEKLKTVGELVWPGGGGEEILRLVAQIRQGGTLDLNSLIKKTLI
jgi:hypothetical protein